VRDGNTGQGGVGVASVNESVMKWRKEVAMEWKLEKFMNRELEVDVCAGRQGR
jgi:hypothetical protein